MRAHSRDLEGALPSCNAQPELELQGRLGECMSGTWSYELSPRPPHTKQLWAPWVESRSGKPMRLWKFLNNLSFGFSFFLFSQMPIFAPHPLFSLEIKLSFQKLVIFNGLIEWLHWLERTFCQLPLIAFFPFKSKVLILSSGSAPN